MITITDLNGRMVEQTELQKVKDELEYKFDLSNNAKGFYIIQVELGGQKNNLKIEVK